MNDISLDFLVSYGSRGAKSKYYPLINALGNRIYKCYGLGFPRNYKFTDEKKDQYCGTSIPEVIGRRIIAPLCRILGVPKYYSYLWKMRWLDSIYANRVANDPSSILFISPLLPKTIEKAKKKQKTIVIEAGNSEPEREFERITREYKKYGIKNKYIYGDSRYRDTCVKSLSYADYVISISKVSLNTYLKAGYPEQKFKLISLAGTDFVVQNNVESLNKKKAFISTAFHSFIKGTHLLLLAWRKANIKDIPLVIVGDLHDDMKEFIAKYGPFDNVIFTGNKYNLSEWYLDYDAVGILLSLSEGAVRVVPEQMSFGFPMITSKDATCDLVEDKQNGIIVDYDNQDAIVEALHYFADDWENVERMRGKVLDSVKNRTLRDYSLEVGEFLGELCSRKVL